MTTDTAIATEAAAAAVTEDTLHAARNVAVESDAAALVVDELLVEEISIDGMCGVY